jgi:hemoglobin
MNDIRAFPSPIIYQRLGKDGLVRLVQAVYRELAQSSIASMFPVGAAALDSAAANSALFFVQVCGGPPLYEQANGPPRMKARHVKFAIDAASRLVWLGCWNRVLDTAATEHGFPAECLPDFRTWLEDFSTWMVSR